MTSASLLALALATAASPTDAGIKKRAEALVAQLGDPDYRDREKAAKELLAIGYAAKDAVLAGQKSADQEISDRCTKLYPAIWKHDLEKRVQRFLDDPAGPLPDDLPGAARWLKVAGDTNASRELYGDMVKAHPEPLLDVELHPERVPTAYLEHVRNVYGRIMPRPVGTTPTARPGPAVEDVLLFLFLGAVGDVRTSVPPGTSTTYYYQFLNSANFTAKLSAGESSAPVRKLFAAWLEKERYSVLLRRGMDIAAQNKVTECRGTVLKIAADPRTVLYLRATALLGLAKLGTKDDLKELEPFLKDKTQIAIVVVNGEQWAIQIRDVALGAAVQLAGESLVDFGFERRPPANLVSVSSYTYYAFSSDENRAAAHRKWKDWAEENLKK
jgi:hypothetical protein